MSKRIFNRIKTQLFFRTAVSDFNLAKKELTSVKDFSGRSLGLQRTSWGLDSWKMRPRFGSTSRKGSASTVTFSSALVILPGLKPGLSSQHMLTKPTNSQTWHPFLKKKKSRVQISASGRVTQCSERVRIMRLTDFFFLWLSIQRRSYFDFESLLLLCSIRTDAAADVHHVSLPAELSNLASAVAALSWGAFAS